MKRIVTRHTHLNYANALPMDISELFSEDVEKGWEVETISTAIDNCEGSPILVVTALLSMDR